MSDNNLGEARSWIVRGLLLGVVAIPVGGHAQSSRPVFLTEAEFLAPLTDDHPAFVELAEALARAEGERIRASALQNPAIGFEREAPADLPAQSTLTIGWTPPLDGRRGLAVAAGEADVESARHDLGWTRLQVRQQLRALYVDWAVAEGRVQLLGRHLESLRGLQERLRVRAERGEESRLAVRRFDLAVAGVRAELARSQAESATVRARALAIRGDLPPGAVPRMPAAPAVPVEISGSIRPDLLARRSEVESARLRQRLAGRLLEMPSLVGGWTWIDDAGSSADGPYFGLAWNLPLFDRNQGGRHESARTVAIAEARLRLAEREVEQRRAAALSAYALLRASLEELAEVVREAPAVADAATASFLVGESSMTDLLEILRSVLESQLEALDLHSQVLAAHREVELSTGHVSNPGETR